MFMRVKMTRISEPEREEFTEEGRNAGKQGAY
jgi:hypothetical protein